MLVNNIKINDNKIILITGESGTGKTNFCNILSKSRKSYMIGCATNFFEKRTVKEELSFIFKYKNNSKNKKYDKIYEAFKMVGLDRSILNRDIFDLSSSEKIRILLCKLLLKNKDVIIIDDIFDLLDDKTRERIFKILLKLKKYYNKTIILSTSNIDLVYDYVDEIMYIKDGKMYKYDDKINIYKNKDENIRIKPFLISIVDKMKKKYPNMSYKDSINELIKELYREIR